MATSSNQPVVLSSFIDSVITEMSTPRKATRRGPGGELVHNDNRAKLCKIIQQMDSPHVLNRIAMARTHLENERAMASRAYQKVQLKPEHLLSLTQDIANQCCWAARSLMMAQRRHEDGREAATTDFTAGLARPWVETEADDVEDDAAHGTTEPMAGVDWSEDVAERVGVTGVSTHLIGEVLEYDAACLEAVYSHLSLKMSYMSDIEDFHLYADRGPVDPTESGSPWVVHRSATTFDEALAIMDDILDKRTDERIAEDRTEAATTDFTAYVGKPNPIA